MRHGAAFEGVITVAHHEEDTVVNAEGNEHDEGEERCIPRQHVATKHVS